MAQDDANSIPALQGPGGLKSNFVNPPTLMPTVIVTSVVVLSTVTLFVSVRLFIKLYITREHGLEDFFSYFAWAGLVTYMSILISIEDYGFARHQWDVTVAMLEHIMYYVNVLYCLYPPTTLAAKLSVLLQIKQIFTTGKKNLVYWVVMVSIVLNLVFYTGLFFSYVFQCWPRQKIWKPTVQGKCISGSESNLAAGILNVISDMEALLLPAWAIWHLKMPLKRKLAAYAVFGVGSMYLFLPITLYAADRGSACIIGITGIYFRVILLEQPDFTWICTKASMLVISEIAVVIIVGCFPSLPRLYHYYRGKRGRLAEPNGCKSNKMSQKYGPKRSSKGNLLSSMAKYMGPEDRMVTLGSTVSNEHLELHRYASHLEHGEGVKSDPTQDSSNSGILKTTLMEQSVDAPGRQ